MAANLVLGFVLGAYVAPDSESALLFGGCALLLGRAAGGVLRYLCPEGSY